jgi:hypothetical protein
MTDDCFIAGNYARKTKEPIGEDVLVEKGVLENIFLIGSRAEILETIDRQRPSGSYRLSLPRIEHTKILPGKDDRKRCVSVDDGFLSLNGGVRLIL